MCLHPYYVTGRHKYKHKYRISYTIIQINKVKSTDNIPIANITSK